ncbi:putative serine/threonine-protein kinase WNK9 isoform X1 [Senna tora]|uniref:non-specific serine/threonine protein kinase n=1 Tax=Senna tora TaxID=362788 RepID=A0A834X301_9FABA|nr:putative serine/threonine-protein kinase WNK9 isoform X1 [Senna tora]
MNGSASIEAEDSEFVEVDPTGRYGRYNEILGKGASKTVYRAFDEYEGIEVAWNQVKLYDFLQNPEDLERLYCEIHLLKTLKHKNIMKFYTSWVDAANRHINFVTEMFTSGTLRQYRIKHKRVNIRAVKHWCRQILEGLLYLHSHDPPVIHRDLKCDNIFINGNQGEVKIGDLGLAAILRKSNAARCVGTPEFMAPEVYEEDYNELVDIYSFGMCILEMVTFEYPYSECTHPAQIYKKVVSGKKPESLYKVKNPEVRQFVEKCLATASLRLSAKELLEDPFLQIDDYGSEMKTIHYQGDVYEVTPLVRQPLDGVHNSNNSFINEYTDYLSGYGPESELTSEIDLFECEDDDNLAEVDTAIKGRRREDDGIFLRLRIADQEGRVRNIYFPFDIDTDTALSVATEMVAELDLTDQDVTKIADMIDNEISNLVPEWKTGLRMEEIPECTSEGLCHNCASNGTFFDYVSSNSPSAQNLQFLHCSRNGCAAVHGRFEEITYQVEGHENCTTTQGAVPAAPSSQSAGLHYTDIWAQRDEPELSSEELRDIHCDKSQEASNQSTSKEDERIISVYDQRDPNTKPTSSSSNGLDCVLLDYENEIRQELRWLKAKYQMQLRELRDQQLEHKKYVGVPKLSVTNQLKIKNRKPVLGHWASKKRYSVDGEKNKKFPITANQMVQEQDVDETSGSNSPDQMVTAKDFYAGALLPHSLHRATSLPVDAIDV